MAKKTTTKKQDVKKSAFAVKITEDDLAACIAKKMSLDDIKETDLYSFFEKVQEVLKMLE